MYDIDEQIDYRENLLLAATGLCSAWQLRRAGSHPPESAALLSFNEGILLNTSLTVSFMKKEKMSREQLKAFTFLIHGF